MLGQEAKPVDRKAPKQVEMSDMDITDGIIIIDDVRLKINSNQQ